jgi:hypothetical protein
MIIARHFSAGYRFKKLGVPEATSAKVVFSAGG